MKYYAIAQINITDPAWVPEYVRNTTRIVEQHGGRYLARTPNFEEVEGEPTPRPQIYLLIQWPSKAAAEAFYNSDEYLPHLLSRKSGSTGELVLLAGEDITGVAEM
jgi:uncharacterized protein (DUF1330 family)